MLIDHIGFVFFPKVLIFRIIGRIAFPIFTYTTMISYFKTKNLKKYLIRLLIIGIISQPIYVLTFGKSLFELNIMFTLIFEVILYYTLDKKKWYILPFCIILPIVFSLSYSVIFWVLVFIFYYFRNNKFAFISSVLLFFYMYILDTSVYIYIPQSITFFSVLSLPFICIKTNYKFKINKYFFYLFYPCHLLLLFLINSII